MKDSILIGRIAEKRLGKVCVILILTALLLSACSLNGNRISTGVTGVSEDGDFGNVLIDMELDDLNALGFKYGDSVDVRFSNGYTLEDIPYYTGFYNPAGEPLLMGFLGTDLVAAINYGKLWEESGLSEGDTVEISLHEAGKYLDIQETLNIAYSDDRSEYESDEIFANFRSVNTGKLKKDLLYRSASPCDNKHNRASYSDDLAEKAGVSMIVDLADCDEEIVGFMSASDFDSPYFESLYEGNSVIALNLQVDYKSEEYRAGIVKALREMSKSGGPYLIHCIEGKDRTGFLCALLECLTGASYDEIEADYMESYKNYYGIDRASDEDKYDAILSNNFVPIVTFITGADESSDISSIDLESGAEAYLISGGMTSEEISALKERLTH